MKPMETERAVSRRGLLRAGAGAVAGTALVGAGGTVTAQMDAYGGYLSEEGTWGGTTTDGTGLEQVSVDVGAEGNGQNFAYAPAALLVDPGTTVTWEWTGAGGAHNVVHDTDAGVGPDEEVFNSGSPVDSAEETFEYTFEGEGVYPYVCIPHESLQMKGVVVVGEDNAETDLVELETGDGDSFNRIAALGGAASVGVVALVGTAIYREILGSDTE